MERLSFRSRACRRDCRTCFRCRPRFRLEAPHRRGPDKTLPAPERRPLPLIRSSVLISEEPWHPPLPSLWHSRRGGVVKFAHAVTLVGRTLGHYALHAFVVMPNHVHVWITPALPLPKLTRSLKGVTAKRVNARLGLTGASEYRWSSAGRAMTQGTPGPPGGSAASIAHGHRGRSSTPMSRTPV